MLFNVEYLYLKEVLIGLGTGMDACMVNLVEDGSMPMQYPDRC